jgi:hypothetical protein
MTSPVDRDLLGRATRALRDEAMADPPAVDESWRAMDGWRQVSRDIRRKARRRRLGLVIALQGIAAVAGVGAWAAVSGRLPPLLARWVGATHSAAPVAPARVRATRARREASPAPATLPAEPPLEPVPDPAVSRPGRSELGPDPAPAVGGTRPVHPAPRTARATAAPPVPAPPGPEEIYARAHRAQFTLRDYAAALVLWDEYLATTGGSLGLEARWNRAIALVRLGRREAAIAALAPFAAGQNEAYRQEEAQALLRVLGATAP